MIASDIQFIMEIDNTDYKMGEQANKAWHRDTLSINFINKKELQRLPDNIVIYTNKKRAITYALTKINETER